MARLACLLASVLVLLTAPRMAYAAASAHLVYVRGPGAERCPAEDAVRAAVSTRIGYDPFFAWAHDTLFAEITRERGALHAEIKLVGDDGRLRGARALSVQGADCRALVDAMGLTISLTIDPSTLLAAPPPQVSAAPSTSPPVPAPVDVPAPSPAAKTGPVPDVHLTPPRVGSDAPARTYAGLGALASVGTAPSVATGGFLFAGLLWHDLSLDLEGRADLPASGEGDLSPARVRTSLVAGSVVPCVHASFVFGCSVLSGGSLGATAVGSVVPLDRHDPWLGTGGRIGIELAITPALFFRAYGELLATVTRDVYTVDQSPAYQLPPWSSDVGLALAWRFP